MTAANVAYGLWSHDIMGPNEDPELFTRWLQWSAYSGVMRMHDRGESAGLCNTDLIHPFHACGVVRPWDAPTKYFEPNRAALRARASLVPYIYSMLAKSYTTGLSLLRPMYYEYPELDAAYKASPDGAFGQFFFGDDLLVSPVVNKASDGFFGDQLAHQKIWVPPGMWIEHDTGAVHVGGDAGHVLDGAFALGEVPVFVRAGAIIPRRPIPRAGLTNGLAAEPYNALELSLYPGATSGSVSIYEDDGTTTAYLEGHHANIIATYTFHSHIINFTLLTTGSFAGQAPTRALTLRVVNAPPAAAVYHGATELKYAAFGGIGTWSYDGPATTLVIEGVRRDTSEQQTISVALPESMAAMWQDGALAGLRGAISHANLAKASLDEVRLTPGSTDMSASGELDKMSSLGEVLSDTAGMDDSFAAWKEVVSASRKQLEAAFAEVKATSMWLHQQIWNSNPELPVSGGLYRKRYGLGLLATSLKQLPVEEYAVLV